jgi:hypothetical protein
MIILVNTRFGPLTHRREPHCAAADETAPGDAI